MLSVRSSDAHPLCFFCCSSFSTSCLIFYHVCFFVLQFNFYKTGFYPLMGFPVSSFFFKFDCLIKFCSGVVWGILKKAHTQLRIFFFFLFASHVSYSGIFKSQTVTEVIRFCLIFPPFPIFYLFIFGNLILSLFRHISRVRPMWYILVNGSNQCFVMNWDLFSLLIQVQRKHIWNLKYFDLENNLEAFNYTTGH